MRFIYWRVSVFIAAAAVPVYWLYLAWIFALGPDPGKVLVDRLGLGTLTLLLITLALTPLQRMMGWPGWIAVRRQLGLWCFTYVSLHMLGYGFFNSRVSELGCKSPHRQCVAWLSDAQRKADDQLTGRTSG